nr:hypothetical protein [uncultured Clostridium sp.]
MRKRLVSSAFIAAALTICTAYQAFAAGPGQTDDPKPEEVTQEQWSRLNDQTIEFDELPDLVKYFNPNMQNTAQTINDSLDNMKYTNDKMRLYIKDLKDDADEMKDSGEINTDKGKNDYIELNINIKILEKTADSMTKTYDYMNRSDSSVKSNITLAAKNYTYYADQVMIGYNSALSNKAMLEKIAELSNAAYEAKSLSKQLGLATDADLLSAQKEVLLAKGSLIKINSTIDNLSRSLCMMTGYAADAAPVIGGLPQLTDETIAALNLEEDTKKAVSNNNDIISERHTSSGKTTTGMKNKEQSVSEAEQNVAVTMQAYYQGILQSKSAYEAACTAFQKATLEKEKADRSFNMKMLSKIQYLQAQMAYLKAQGEKESAYNTYYQAYNTYQWAVKGIIMDSAK